jgi:hypothetical protein
MGGYEYWVEVDVTNTGSKPEAFTLTVQRYQGKPLLENNYTVAPGQKQSVRLEDPKANFESADGQGELPTYAMLIQYASPALRMDVRQMDLQGNKLTTLELHSIPQDTTFRIRYRMPAGERPYTLWNTSSTPQTVLTCMGDTAEHCDTNSERTVLAPNGVVRETLRANTAQYIFMSKSTAVLSGIYQDKPGTVSNFNVSSGVSFGAPLDDSK